MVKEGEPNIIKKSAVREETRKFLENLGFVTGGTVTVISQTGGNMIVNVKGFQSCHWKDMAIQDYGIDIGNAMMNYTEKEQSMKTLKEVACGQTVKVKKLTGEGSGQETYHGYGYHQRVWISM